jgi:hypothetical protein
MYLCTQKWCQGLELADAPFIECKEKFFDPFMGRGIEGREYWVC